MKLFTFIGKSLDSVEGITSKLIGEKGLVDSLITTTVTVSNTVGEYANIQLAVAEQEKPIALAEARFEGQARILELRKKIDAISKVGDNPTPEMTTEELLKAMGGE